MVRLQKGFILGLFLILLVSDYACIFEISFLITMEMPNLNYLFFIEDFSAHLLLVMYISSINMKVFISSKGEILYFFTLI